MKFLSGYTLKGTVIILFVISFSSSLYGQVNTAFPTQHKTLLDQGIRFNAPDSSVGIRVGFRLQPQLNSVVKLEQGGQPSRKSQVQSMLRRARVWFKGYVLDEEFNYFVNFWFDKGQSKIGDAVLEWRPNKNHLVGIGQFRVFENRQNRISSGCLQFVDRSRVSYYFTQGYDLGFYWNGIWVPADEPGFKLYVSASHGEGMNEPTASGGYLYTGRLELLPLGGFQSNADYTGGVLDLQPEPKLSIGLAASLNRDYHPLYGDRISMQDGVDVTSLFADAMFKYRSTSLLGEAYWRNVEEEVLEVPGIGPSISSMTGGYGYLLQAGRMVTRKLEIAARYETLRPEHDTELELLSNNREDRYGMGGSWYIHRQNLKIQADVVVVDEMDRGLNQHQRYLESRLQFQMNF